jgi:hypothetical protein
MKGLKSYNPGWHGKESLQDALSLALRRDPPESLQAPIAALWSALAALPVPSNSLAGAPPCPQELYWHSDYNAYTTWLRAKFPSAKIVDIHRSKSTPLPVVQTGSGAYVMYNFFFYVVVLAWDDYKRAQNLPPHRASGSGEFQSSFCYTTENGEAMIECDRVCVEELLAQRIIY